MAGSYPDRCQSPACFQVGWGFGLEVGIGVHMGVALLGNDKETFVSIRFVLNQLF